MNTEQRLNRQTLKRTGILIIAPNAVNGFVLIVSMTAAESVVKNAATIIYNLASFVDRFLFFFRLIFTMDLICSLSSRNELSLITYELSDENKMEVFK